MKDQKNNYKLNPPVFSSKELKDEITKKIESELRQGIAEPSNEFINSIKDDFKIPTPQLLFEKTRIETLSTKDSQKYPVEIKTFSVPFEGDEAILKHMWGWGPSNDLEIDLHWVDFGFELGNKEICYQISYGTFSTDDYKKSLEEAGKKHLMYAYRQLCSKIDKTNESLSEDSIKELHIERVQTLNGGILKNQFHKHPERKQSWIPRNKIEIVDALPDPVILEIYPYECKAIYKKRLIEFKFETNNWKLFHALVENLENGIKQDQNGIGKTFDHSKVDNFAELTKQLKHELVTFLERHGREGCELSAKIINKKGVILLELNSKQIRIVNNNNPTKAIKIPTKKAKKSLKPNQSMKKLN